MKKQNSEKNKNPVEQLQHTPAKDEFLIVGIGASAGGIQALQEFFRNVPVDSGMAYVVILHLSPDHDSQLAEILQRESKIPVAQVTKRVNIQPNHIYVIPPNKHLTMEDGFIAVTENTVIAERRAPVDIFLRTLADEHGPRAVAVILSGTGANGSMGLKRIKERGGACFVQNPHEAEFSEMPRNAIATEMIDDVLSVSKIPSTLLSFKASLVTVDITEDVEKSPEDQQQALREIFTHLRVRTGHDFSNYKRPTLLRRIERRINIRNLPNLPAYAKFFLATPDEPTALLKDLLISVTNFFRDKKPFEMIEQEILPIIFKGKTSEDQIRIWVAGCATGEEAYSVAMLCAEKLMGSIDAPKVQIFATDIDENAIVTAREGLYTLNDVADVSPERLLQFFTKEDNCYRIRRELREMVLFATHNFLKDPPFSHLDLVTCRNVMIYLNSVAQERVVETFHFALNPAAYLFLGTSESIDGATDLYALYSRENHIFQSRNVTVKVYPIPESVPALYLDKYKKEIPLPPPETKIPERISYGDLHQQLLEEYAPPSLVINEEYDILHLTEKAGRYLQFAGGEPSQNLLKVIKPELRLELRSALYQAVQQQSPVQAAGLKVRVEKETETINIHVRPVLRTGNAAKGFLLVLFEPASEGEKQRVLLSTDEPLAKQLEEELIRIKAQLRAANEQHDFQAEEMKASNEEWQAMNEELRSAAEELETSKEELQSMNEEMRTVNQELKVKIEETSIASNNLNNIINSTDIGTIFLDRGFKVVLFTPAARELFNLIPADHGRSLSDITSHLEYTDLLHDTETVLDKLRTIEKEVRTKNGAVFLMRITPYRTDEDRVKGVVITFLNITFRKEAEDVLQKSEQRLQRMVNVPQVGVLTLTYEGVILHASDAFLHMLGYTRDEFIARRFGWRDFMPPEHIDASRSILKQLQETGRGGPYEKECFGKDGAKIWIMFVAADLGDGTFVEYAVDVSARKKMEEAVRASEEKYRTLFNSIDEGFSLIELIFDDKGKVVDYRLRETNTVYEQLTGMHHALGKHDKEVLPNLEPEWLEMFEKVHATGESMRFEYPLADLRRFYSVHLARVGGEGSRLVVTVFDDITQRKNAERRQAFLLKFSDAVRPITDPNEIRSTAMRLMGSHLDVNRAVYIDAENEPDKMRVISDYAKGVEPWEGTVSLSDFGAALGKDFAEGKTVVITDVQADKRLANSRNTFTALEIGATVAVPLYKNRQVVAAVGVHTKAQRFWTLEEIMLVEEIAERTWSAVERARGEEALKQFNDQLEAQVKERTEELQMNLTLLQQAEALATVGSWEYNISAGGFYWSDGMYRMFELAHGTDVTPDIYIQLAIAKDKPLAIAMVDKIKSGASPIDETICLKIGDGVRIVKVKGNAIVDEEGEPVKVVGVDMDITLSWQTEKTLEQQAHFIQSTNAALPDILFVMNLTTKAFTYINHSFEEKIGYSEEQGKSIKIPLLDIMHEEDRPLMLAHIEEMKTALTGEIREIEYRLIGPDGSLRWFNDRNVVFRRDKDGIPVEKIGIAQEITARKRTEQELKTTNNSLRYANENLQQFASIASHDLQEPLRKLKLFASVLKRYNDELPQEGKELLSKIHLTSDRMSQLIREVLQYSKIAYGEKEFVPTSLDDIFRVVLGDLDLLLEETKAVIEYTEPLPQIEALPPQINQLFYNLLTNALKFRKEGAPPAIQVSFEPISTAAKAKQPELREDKDYIEIKFSDKGIGFEQDYAEQIFQIFERLHSVDEFEGTGVGLALCKKIVENHSGHIYAVSNEGEGASFHIILPIKQ